MKKFSLTLILIIVFSSLSCKKDDNPVVSELGSFQYPLAIGNQWDYQRTFSVENFRSDSAGANISIDTSITHSVHMEIVRKEVLHNSIETYVLQEIIIENAYRFIDETYFANQDSGLYFYAYNYGGIMIPKATTNKKFIFKGRAFSTVKDITSYITKAIPSNYSLVDSLTYEIPPLASLKYPLKSNSEWTYRYSGTRIDKKVIGLEQINVRGGKFTCYKIQWLYDMNNDTKWDDDIIFYDYVCEKGLIQRSIFLKDIIVASEESPEGIGKVDVKDESILTHLNF